VPRPLGCRLRAAAERLGVGGASPLARAGIGLDRARAAHAEGVAAGRLDAARRLRRIRERLDAETWAILVAVCVEDLSWERLSWRLHCTDKTAKLRAIEALQRLALSPRRSDERESARHGHDSIK
jgi:hypothetical protein